MKWLCASGLGFLFFSLDILVSISFELARLYISLSSPYFFHFGLHDDLNDLSSAGKYTDDFLQR